MIEKRNLLDTVVSKSRTLSVGDYLEVLSYKRDRGFRLIRLGQETYQIEEEGFEQREYRLGGGELKPRLKRIIKREFPRSNKLRLYMMGAYDPFAARKVERKTI